MILQKAKNDINNIQFDQCTDKQALSKLLPKDFLEKKGWEKIAKQNRLNEYNAFKAKAYFKNVPAEKIDLTTLEQLINDKKSLMGDYKKEIPYWIAGGFVGFTVSGVLFYGGHKGWPYVETTWNKLGKKGGLIGTLGQAGMLLGGIAVATPLSYIILGPAMLGLFSFILGLSHTKRAYISPKSLLTLKNLYKNIAIIKLLQDDQKISEGFHTFKDQDFYNIDFNYSSD